MGGVKSHTGRLIKPYVYPKSGRKDVGVRSSSDGIRTTYQVSHLVGKLFCPDYHPSKRAQFLDGNPSNCHAHNMRWVSVSESTRNYNRRKK